MLFWQTLEELAKIWISWAYLTKGMPCSRVEQAGTAVASKSFHGSLHAELSMLMWSNENSKIFQFVEQVCRFWEGHC